MVEQSLSERVRGSKRAMVECMSCAKSIVAYKSCWCPACERVMCSACYGVAGRCQSCTVVLIARAAAAAAATHGGRAVHTVLVRDELV